MRTETQKTTIRREIKTLSRIGKKTYRTRVCLLAIEMYSDLVGYSWRYEVTKQFDKDAPLIWTYTDYGEALNAFTELAIETAKYV